MDYYKQLKPIADRVMRRFKTDFTNYDRKNLNRKNQSGIWAVRPSGSDLFLFGRDQDTINHLTRLVQKKEKRIRSFYDIKTALKNAHWGYLCISFEGRNTEFYHLEKGNVRKVSQQQAIEIADDYLTFVSFQIEKKITGQREVVR